MAIPIVNRMLKLFIISILALGALPFLFSCKSFGKPAQTGTFRQVTAQEAKEMMDTESNYIILDVRAESEFAEGHIEGAIVIPHTEIAARAEAELPDKDQLIFVYCRSGARSKIAAQELANLGYTNIVEFGGILSWQYGTVQ